MFKSSTKPIVCEITAKYLIHLHLPSHCSTVHNLVLTSCSSYQLILSVYGVTHIYEGDLSSITVTVFVSLHKGLLDLILCTDHAWQSPTVVVYYFNKSYTPCNFAFV